MALILFSILNFISIIKNNYTTKPINLQFFSTVFGKLYFVESPFYRNGDRCTLKL